MENVGNGERARAWLYLFLFTAFISAGVLFVLQGMTTYTSDDYYYALFWRDGLGGFISQNIEHFYVRNGRVMVHLLAETLLAGGMWVFVQPRR